MIACLDVDYRENEAVAAAVFIRRWSDGEAARELVHASPAPAPYRPGKFYRRELPPLLSLLGKLNEIPETLVVDGYVWLSENRDPGLGGYLFRALEGKAAVVGVAKNPFRGSSFARKVFRGKSRRPLYVTAAGMDPERAAEGVRTMAGRYRIPFILKKVDSLCRQSR